MKKLVLVISMIVPTFSVAAPEPEIIGKVRAEFLSAAKEAGLDPKQCSITFLETIPEGHIIETVCANLPKRCLFLVHPTEPMVAPLQCIPNLDFKPVTKT